MLYTTHEADAITALILCLWKLWHTESQLTRVLGFLNEGPYIQVPVLSDCRLHTGLQDAFLPPIQEWNKILTGKDGKTACKTFYEVYLFTIKW